MVAPDGIGVLLRTIREGADRTREQQGRLIGQAHGRPFDEANLKRWETEKRFPVPHWHPTIAAVYEITVEQVRAAVATSQRYRKAQNKENDVKRRNFGLAVAAAGASVLPGIARAREGIDGALAGSAQGELDYLQAAFERHRGGYRGRSPDAVLAEMHQDLDLLGHALARPHPVRERADLARTAAGIAGLVAIVQHDRGDQVDAHHWFTTAARAARESGDRHMSAWVLARQAMVPLNYGAPAAAAKIAAQARREAGRAPSAAGALAAAVTARSLAALGDRRGATAALEDLRTLAERLDGQATADTWFGYPEQKHHVHLSQAYTLLGNTKAAYQAQDQALALTDSPSVMTRALLAMDTATCLRTDKDPNAAADMAAGVFTRLPGPYREGLVRTRATSLQHSLTGRPRDRLAQALT
ncbi:transcriptional regulator [Streptomyces sp. NPDC089919]|uniref:transcriptional regulator n=1 Tax=Streptomyces sp. NPDC089919 TaxID=3155188 RepID=UPI003418FC05